MKQEDRLETRSWREVTEMLNDTSKLRHIGKSVKIGTFVKIVHPELVSVDDYSRIDDFSLLVPAQEGISIGKYVHIASFSSISGGGTFVMEDFAGFAPGVRIFTGTDDYLGNGLTNPTIPKEYLRPIVSKVHIMKHAIIGANVVVLPGVTIGIGASIGANSLVNKDLPDWTVCYGTPCKPVKERKKEAILQMEQELIDKYHKGHL
jgi:galactoside O-acetyltransferase